MEPLLLHTYTKLQEWGERGHGHASVTCGAQEQGICQSFVPHESKVVHHLASMLKFVAAARSQSVVC